MSPLESALLRAVASSGQDAVAQAISKDVSTVSRIFANDGGIRLRDLETFLEALGYKAVPLDHVTVERKEYCSLVYLAAKHLDGKREETNE